MPLPSHECVSCITDTVSMVDEIIAHITSARDVRLNVRFPDKIGKKEGISRVWRICSFVIFCRVYLKLCCYSVLIMLIKTAKRAWPS